MRLEAYDRDRHYALVAQWWKGYADTDCLPPDCLPDGRVAVIDGAPAAAGFCYLAGNARAALIDFVICAPDLAKLQRFRAVRAVLQALVELARDNGCKVIWSSTNHAGLDRIYTEHAGFTRTTQHHHYFMLLDPAVPPDMLAGEEFFEKG